MTEVIEMPARMQRLPQGRRGPVPFFISPTRMVVDEGNVRRAINLHLCIVCGDMLGKYRAFHVDAMACVAGIAENPPAHTECSDYAARTHRQIAQPYAHQGAGALVGVWIVTRARWSKNGTQRLWILDEAPVQVRWYRDGELAAPDVVVDELRAVQENESGTWEPAALAKRVDLCVEKYTPRWGEG